MKKYLSLIIILNIVAIAYLVKNSRALFSDREELSGNSITTAVEFGNNLPSPSPTVKLIINEVYYYPDQLQHGNKTESDPLNEWIEIYNPNNTDVPFKDWQICNSIGCESINPNVKVPALGFALVSHDGDTWNFWTLPEGVEKINSLNGTPLSLNNTGDRVVLLNAQGIEIDRMSYGTDTSGFDKGCSTTCPEVTAAGHSLERDPEGYDTNDALNFKDRDPPTPGS